ncbi:hypothetical protein O3P69_020821 [Scylla paramamosain]|uniref:Secreted protein n=1 Tax=Scylla paramamosain TaxID=85552 RepID=A0AAW0TMV6_SCYPA
MKGPAAGIRFLCVLKVNLIASPYAQTQGYVKRTPCSPRHVLCGGALPEALERLLMSTGVVVPAWLTRHGV